MTLYPYLIVDLPVRDSATHTYQTDPLNPLAPTQPGISLVKLGDSVPFVRAFNITVYNYADTACSVQLIANENAKNYEYGRLLDGLDYEVEAAYPDYQVGSPVSVNPSPATGVPSVEALQYHVDTEAAERYISLSVAYTSPPTTGFIRAHLLLLYGGY